MTLAGQKAYSVDEIRKTYTKAYAPWTKGEDNLLKQDYERFLQLKHPEENFISECARKFGRKPGGIRSRIAKLLSGEITYKQRFSSGKNPQLVAKTHHTEVDSISQPQFKPVILPDHLSSDQKIVLNSLLSWIRNPKNGYITVG